jgi:ATP-dependent Clp protease ATP-binding subunit ClpA
MYERFTDRARKIMQLANQEAQRHNHEYIGTEHILLGLILEGSGVAANVLKNLDIDLRKIRLEVERFLRNGPDLVTLGKLPQTPATQKVIKYSMEESRNLGHDYVGSEHILLGLLREHDGVAAQILINFGMTTEKVRQEFLNIIGQEFRKGNDKKPVERQLIKDKLDELSQVPRLKKIVEYALEEARFMQHDYVGGEHILLGLFHEHESVVAQVLEHFGLKINEVRLEILRRLGENEPK